MNGCSLSLEQVAILGLALLFVVVVWGVRHGERRRRRARRSDLDPDYQRRFETTAQQTARALLFAAIAHLESRDATWPRGEVEAVRQAAGHLAQALRTLRQGGPEHSGPAQRRWDYLAGLYSARFPLLRPAVDGQDLPTLEQLANGSGETTGAHLDGELRGGLQRLRAALEALETSPHLVWSHVDLVVLTILQLAPSPEHESAAARRVSLPSSKRDSESQVLAAGLDFSLFLLNAVPRRFRRFHRDVPVPTLIDPELGETIVRCRLNQAAPEGPMVRANALVLGEPEFLWLALAVADTQEFPQEAWTAYARMRSVLGRMYPNLVAPTRAGERSLAGARAGESVRDEAGDPSHDPEPSAELRRALLDTFPEPQRSQVEAIIAELARGTDAADVDALVASSRSEQP